MSRLWLGVFALILAALVFLVASPALGFSRHASIDAVASWLAGRTVYVRCLTPRESRDDPIINAWGASAYVEGDRDRLNRWRPFDYTVFAHGHCGPLRSLLRRDLLDYSMQDYAWAVLVLVHESGHLKGHRWSSDEALTQTWALRHFVYAAMRLNVSEEEARELLRLAVAIHLDQPSEYRAPECSKPWVDELGRLQDCQPSPVVP